MDVPIKDIHGEALATLTVLCERQEELTLPAHIAVMNAFNNLVEDNPVLPGSEPSRSRESIVSLLLRAHAAVDVLDSHANDLRSHLRFLELRDLIDEAIRQS